MQPDGAQDEDDGRGAQRRDSFGRAKPVGFMTAASTMRSNEERPTSQPVRQPRPSAGAASGSAKGGGKACSQPDIRRFFGGGGGGGGGSSSPAGDKKAVAAPRETSSSKPSGGAAPPSSSAAQSGTRGQAFKASSTAQLESVVVGRQFHAPLPTDLSGLTLQVVREPHNAVDPLALLVQTDVGVALGHIPARVSKVLSPLVDGGHVSLSAALLNPDAPPPASVNSPLPVMVIVQYLHDMPAFSPHVQPLLSLVEQQNKRKAKVHAEDKAKRDRLKYSQRSLLHNFGAGAQVATSLRSGGCQSATLLSDMPEPVLQQIFLGGGLPTREVLTSVRSTCRRWRATVDSLVQDARLSWRVSVLKLCSIAGAASDAVTSSILSDSALSSSSLPTLLSHLVKHMRTAYTPALPRDFIARLACDCGGPADWMQGLDLLCRDFDHSSPDHKLTGPDDGWPYLAICLLTAPSATRHAMIHSLMPPPGHKRLVDGSDFLSFLAWLICTLAQDDGRGSPTIWSGLREDLIIAYQRLEARAVDITSDRLRYSKGGKKLTSEQQDIVMTEDRPQGKKQGAAEQQQDKEEEPPLLVVTAFAGTGKTTTLRAYAEARPDRRMLYLCFNVSVREEAQRNFPPNVAAKNIHQLAFAHVGHRYTKKLQPELKLTDIADLIRPTLPGGAASSSESSSSSNPSKQSLVLASCVMATLSTFFASADPALSLTHANDSLPAAGRAGKAVDAAEVQSWADRLWSKMKDTGDTSVPMTHSGYMKLFQLSRPCLSRAYDVIMLDEAQDISPAIGDVILRQKVPRVLCGDSHQAIYSFMGAQDYVRQAGTQQGGGEGSSCRRKHLSECFRFGREIAEVASALLRLFKGETRRLVGLGPAGRVLLPDAELQEPWTFIARTNATLISTCIELVSAGKRVAFVGGLESYRFDLLADVCHLALNDKESISSTFVKRFRSVRTLLSFADETEDTEWGNRCKLVMAHGPHRLLELIAHLEAKAAAAPKDARGRAAEMAEAQVVLSTVHKAKGLEFDRVGLAEDFVGLCEEDEDNPEAGRRRVNRNIDLEEVNMLYVACTRAKTELRLNADLEAWLRLSGACTRFTISTGFRGEPCDRCEGKVDGWVEGAADKSAVLVVKLEGSERALCTRCLTSKFRTVRALVTPYPPPPPPPPVPTWHGADVVVLMDDEEEEEEDDGV